MINVWLDLPVFVTEDRVRVIVDERGGFAIGIVRSASPSFHSVG